MDYKEINITEWNQVGEGGIGKTYELRSNPDILLKVNKGDMNNEATVNREFELSQHVLQLGLSTPRMFDLVRIGEDFGYTFECIRGKKSLSRICADNPERIPEAAAILAKEGRTLHATQCDTAFFPSHREIILKAIDAAGYVSEDDKAKLRAFTQNIPEETTCVHGDFHSGNLIVSGEGKPYWIDLGWFSYGSPWFDLGHLFLLCMVYSRFPTTQDIFHMSHEQMKAFWEAFATAYTGKADHADFDKKAEMFAALDVICTSYLHPHPTAEKMFAYVVHDIVERRY